MDNSSLYQIVNMEESKNILTVNFLCNKEPIQYSLLQCSFAFDEYQYSIHEILQYCLKSEEYLDIRGLYSSEYEQFIVHNLYTQLHK